MFVLAVSSITKKQYQEIVTMDSLSLSPNLYDMIKTQSSNSKEIKECLLFLQNNKMVGYSYIEGATDVKNCNAMYELIPQENTLERQVEVLNRVIDYAFQLGMLDINFEIDHDKSPYQIVASEHNYEIEVGEGIIIFSKEYEKELLESKNR